MCMRHVICINTVRGYSLSAPSGSSEPTPLLPLMYRYIHLYETNPISPELILFSIPLYEKLTLFIYQSPRAILSDFA